MILAISVLSETQIREGEGGLKEEEEDGIGSGAGQDAGVPSVAWCGQVRLCGRVCVVACVATRLAGSIETRETDRVARLPTCLGVRESRDFLIVYPTPPSLFI